MNVLPYHFDFDVSLRHDGLDFKFHLKEFVFVKLNIYFCLFLKCQSMDEQICHYKVGGNNFFNEYSLTESRHTNFCRDFNSMRQNVSLFYNRVTPVNTKDPLCRSKNF